MTVEEDILELRRRINILESEKGSRKKWMRERFDTMSNIIYRHDAVLQKAAGDLNMATRTLQQLLQEFYAGDRTA
jgi:hypothetical protein